MKDRSVDIRQLQIFRAIAENRSFTKAAESLRIAQPAVSIAMRKLEDELELVLFNRQEKRISLTAEGEIFFEHARRILAEMHSAATEMQELRWLGKGEVRLGIPPMMSAYFFPRIIRQFSEMYPKLQVSVFGEGATTIQRMIMQGDLDMGVVAGGTFPPTLEVRPFLREEVVICVHKDHPLAGRKCMPPAEFTAQPLVFYKEGYYLREMIFEMLRESGLQPTIRVESNLYTLVRSLVKEGMGISVFLKMVVADDPDLRAISFDPPLHLDLLMAWKKHRYLSKANRAFVDFLLAHTSKDAADPT